MKFNKFATYMLCSVATACVALFITFKYLVPLTTGDYYRQEVSNGS